MGPPCWSWAQGVAKPVPPMLWEHPRRSTRRRRACFRKAVRVATPALAGGETNSLGRVTWSSGALHDVAVMFDMNCSAPAAIQSVVAVPERPEVFQRCGGRATLRILAAHHR
jgi:hypothetical protein